MKITVDCVSKEKVLKSTYREKMWKCYFKHKTDELKDLWIPFLSQVMLDHKEFMKDPLLIQMSDRYLFENIVKREIPLDPTMPLETPPISPEEQNAIGYAAGYVMRSMKIKLSKSSSASSKALVGFIDTLHVDEEKEPFWSTQNKSKPWWTLSYSRQCFETFEAIKVVQHAYLKDLQHP